MTVKMLVFTTENYLYPDTISCSRYVLFLLKMHYRIVGGVCECCGHGGVQHFSHFNKYVLNPIQREGYTGDGRRAMFVLKNEVLDKCLLRRTKETQAADMELPPRIVQIRPIRLHPIEEVTIICTHSFYSNSLDCWLNSPICHLRISILPYTPRPRAHSMTMLIAVPS